MLTGWRRGFLVGWGLLAALVGTPSGSFAADKNITLLAQRAATNPTGGYGPGYSGCWGYGDSLGREFALMCGYFELDIWDVTNPANPILAKTIPTTGSDLKQVRPYRHYLYAVNQSGPLQIIDVSDPYNASTVAGYLPCAAGAGSHTIHIDGHYAYLNTAGSCARDLRILDLTDPLNPVEVGHYTYPGPGFVDAHDSYVYGNTCYVANLAGGVSILDVSNKTQPVLQAIITYPGNFDHNCWTTTDGKYLLTTDETCQGHLRVWDVRDLSNIREVGSYAAGPNHIIHNVQVNGVWAFISYYSEGVKVVDIEDPTDPIEVGSYDTYPQGSTCSYGGCWDVFPYFPSGTLVASDMANGMFLLRFNGARAGRIEGRVFNVGNGQSVAGATVRLLEIGKSFVTGTDGRYAFRTGDGLRTIEVSRPGFRTDTVQVTAVLSDTISADLPLTPTLQGDFNGDLEVNLADVVVLINAVVFNIPPLAPQAADLTGDCLVDLVDIITLINFVVFNNVSLQSCPP